MVARVKKPGPVSARKAASQDLQKSFTKELPELGVNFVFKHYKTLLPQHIKNQSFLGGAFPLAVSSMPSMPDLFHKSLSKNIGSASSRKHQAAEQPL